MKNPFPEAIEILYRDGWTCGTMNADDLSQSTCLEGAVNQALTGRRDYLLGRAAHCVQQAIEQLWGLPGCGWDFNDICGIPSEGLQTCPPWTGAGFTAVVDVLERAGKIWEAGE